MIPFDVPQPWPNALDAMLTAAFLLAAIGVPAAGYVFMALDVRAYLRSLRRGLVVIGRYFALGDIPEWARQQTPRAIAALGLRMPCSEADVMRAYRTRVKQLHPDHGGDQRRFLLLQANFEEALAILRAEAAEEEPAWPRRQPAA
jgi:hypothetical protein